MCMKSLYAQLEHRVGPCVHRTKGNTNLFQKKIGNVHIALKGNPLILMSIFQKGKGLIKVLSNFVVTFL